MNQKTKDGANAKRGTFSVYSDSDFKGECPRRIIKLQKILKKMERVVVAFSGGGDSTFLLKVAIDALGKENVLAVTAKSETYPEREYNSALELVRKLKARGMTIHTKETKNPAFLKNPVKRCYYCKRELFGRLKEIAEKIGSHYVIDGSNMDDKKDLRFGSIAARELGIRSPLAEARIDKKEIKTFSKRLGLTTWDKPSFACLASRFPYGHAITGENLKKVDRAEELLQRYGFKQVRVRLHGNIARIELLPRDIKRLSGEKLRKDIADKLRKLGFLYITLDLEGYRTGSMNEVLK